jgi:hypothetical protein
MQVPHMLTDYVMSTAIEEYINDEELHRTVMEQKTQAVCQSTPRRPPPPFFSLVLRLRAH